MPMKIKTAEVDGKTYGVLSDDGKPIYENDDGKDFVADVPSMYGKITALTGEAMGHRKAKEAAETKLKEFEGIEDPAAAVKALTTVKNLDEKKMVDAGKVEEIKAAAIASVEEKYKPIVAERDTLKTQLDNEVIGGSFARSKYIGDKIAIPSELVQAHFGKHFAVKEGKLTATDQAGNPIYSGAKPGELADFDEAIETLVNAYPQKDMILKGASGSGGGAKATTGTGGNKTITRAEFSKLDPAAAAAKVGVEGFKVIDG